MELIKSLRNYAPFGLPVSRISWTSLHLSDAITAYGRHQTATALGMRRLADRHNKAHPAHSIYAGQLFTAGIICDILRYLTRIYCHQEHRESIHQCLRVISSRRSEAVSNKVPPAFAHFFPPAPVLLDETSLESFMAGRNEISSNLETTVTETLLLSLAIENPAFRPLGALFEHVELRKAAPYSDFVREAESFFATQPPLSLTGLELFETLRAPMLAAPHSLEGQLAFIKERWSHFLPAELIELLLLAFGVLREEKEKHGLGPGPTEVLHFDKGQYGEVDNYYAEKAAFSPDADWMPNVVLIAKTAYVWLDQLSKKYQRSIHLLSDIPDEELDCLARWGFTGLWLIGIWERSQASQKIKQMMGNPEAAASAYSLYDYNVASDLGGHNAYMNLRERAWQRGIRLASDMVPNHMGIFSSWVVEHPDWFLQLSQPPFPAYNFTGADLSDDQRVMIQIEDGYWGHRDAAVVFKRTDKWTGDARYIYHGNDGTSMPWNDTAQLNYTMAEVREAVIQTILHVARLFPIIRFDAAMTLAKRHYQRLWFPQPGDGGAIPSRAEHSLSRDEFNRVFPKEFWRELVDRVAAEQPDTLLLAEAFWLMEGYFVRTLGMHRVYNSAFMNMLKMEENSKYRMTVKNVLEFSPEILKRFVNFMNNPDERTAVDQFGRGDKYFGVAMMMVTMPGLPMFGHGQIEGFTEKYGMEYRRAYWDEQIDEEMVHRHEREIFPLVKQRYLFSGSENFALYDFVTPDGWVDENVFAYSNRYHDKKAVIIYNNAYNDTRGAIRLSTSMNTGDAESPYYVRRQIHEALGLNIDEGTYYSFRDHRNGLEYIRSGRQIANDGLYVELYAYQYHAFLDFREIRDTDQSWGRLNARLNGRGVPDLELARKEMLYEPILLPYRELVREILTCSENRTAESDKFISKEKCRNFLTAVKVHIGSKIDAGPMCQATLDELKQPLSKEFISLLNESNLPLPEPDRNQYCHILTIAILLGRLDQLSPPDSEKDKKHFSVSYFDDWLLAKVTQDELVQALGNQDAAFRQTQLIRILLSVRNPFEETNDAAFVESFANLFDASAARSFLNINSYNNVVWFGKELMEQLIYILLMEAARTRWGRKAKTPTFDALVDRAVEIVALSHKSGYRLQQFLELVEVRFKASNSAVNRPRH